MSELLSKVAELLNAPESLVQRSAEARAEASGRTVDEVLQSWAGGESVASVEKPAEEAPPAEEPTPPAEEPVTTSDDEKEEEESTEDLAIVVEETISEMSAEVLIEEENIEIKKESSLGFIAGVIGVVIFTYLFAFSIPKQQSEEVVLQSLNNSVRVSEEILELSLIHI